MNTTQTDSRESATPPRLTLVPNTAPLAPQLMGESQLMCRLRETIEQKKDDRVILVLGESGTGKTEVARQLHRRSGRLGALIEEWGSGLDHPATVGEVRWFGVEEGADWSNLRGGTPLVTILEQARYGTVLIRSVGDMPMAEQDALVKFLRKGMFRRPSDGRKIEHPVHIVATSNTPMEPKVAAGAFRPDLYEALFRSVIRTPLLLEHPEDLPMIAQGFLTEIFAKRGWLPPPFTNKREVAGLVADLAGQALWEVRYSLECAANILEEQQATAPRRRRRPTVR